MKVLDLLNIANNGYPDKYLTSYFNPRTGERRRGWGDSLALFVVNELTGSFIEHTSSDEQLKEAIRVMEAAISDLTGVIASLQAEENKK